MVVLFNLLLCSLVTALQIEPPRSSSIPSRIWSNSPASFYNDSYLIGNGRLGGGVKGGVASDIFSVNEDSFWSGGFLDRVNPDARSYMPQMQSLIREGRNLEAGRLAGFAYVGTPVSTRH
jgi:alpha-L-fucosidase 2